MESTRDRILDVAADLLDRHGHGVSLVEIARGAKVSRQTVYLLFRDRLGLMTALWQRNLDHEPAMHAFIASVSLPPLLAFEGFFRNWVRAGIRMERSTRWIWAMEEQDEALLETIRTSDLDWVKHCRQIFERVASAGYLRPRWTVGDAVDAAWMTNLYPVFLGHVRNLRDWSPRQIEDRAMSVLRAAFLTDAASALIESGASPAAVARPQPQRASRPAKRKRRSRRG